MSPVCRDAVAALVLLLIALVIWGVWPAFAAWRAKRRERRELLSQFRLSLRAFDSRHVDVWARQLGGREPPH